MCGLPHLKHLELPEPELEPPPNPRLDFKFFQNFFLFPLRVLPHFLLFVEAVLRVEGSIPPELEILES